MVRDVTDLPHVPLRLLGNRVLVLRDQSPSKIGLLHVPDIALDVKFSGVVLGVGPGKEHVCKTCRRGQGTFKMPVARGDRIFWKRYAERSDSRAQIPGFEIVGKNDQPQQLVFLDAETDLIGREVEGGFGFELFRDVIAVRRRDPSKSQGGILIPDSAQKPENEGRLVVVGPGATGDDGTLLPMQYEAGQYVYWPEHAEQAEPALKKFERKPLEGQVPEQLVLLMEHMIELVGEPEQAAAQ